MRILHLASTLGPIGSARFLAHLAPGLKREGIEQHIITIGEVAPFGELLQTSMPVERVRVRGLLDIGNARTVHRRIVEFAPDVLHVWGNEAAVLANGLLTVSCKLPPMVASDIVPTNGIRRFLVQRVLKAVNRRTIPVVELPNDELVSLASLGVPPSARIVVNVGRFDNITDQRVAVWIFDILKHTSPDLHLVIVGDGPQRAKVEQFAESLSHGVKRVHCVGLRSDVPAILATASVVLVTHRSGGRTVALEAMAAGKPVVAWETLEIPAVRVKTGDRVAAAAAMNRILENPEQARQLAEEGRAIAVQHSLKIHEWMEWYELESRVS